MIAELENRRDELPKGSFGQIKPDINEGRQ
jgi:hypothetical protein